MPARRAGANGVVAKAGVVADKETYKGRLRQADAVIEAHFGAHGVSAEHDEAARTITYAELWGGVLAGRAELPVLHASIDELESGFYNLAAGQYRDAYGNLRLSVELGMATVQFSVDELALRQWLGDKSDIIWSNLIKEQDKDKPLFTVAYVEAFNEDMAGRWTQYRTIANALHRELSTHVHGAASTRRSTRKLTFNREKALGWFGMCKDAHLAWQYLMLARYSDHLLSVKATLSPAFRDMLRSEFAMIDEAKATLNELGC
jgi:hypothetical protein